MAHNTIDAVPFDKLYTEISLGTPLADALQKLKITPFTSWVLPQLTSFLAPIGASVPRNSEGMYTASAFLEMLKVWYIDSGQYSPEFVKGVLKFITAKNRGDIVGRQTTTTRYAANVPIVFAAFKQNRNIPYSAWDLTDPKLSHILDPKLLELLQLMSTYTPKWSPEELLELRDLASYIKTGKSAGTRRNTLSMCTIYTVPDIEFNTLPNLGKVILLQTWVCHPSIRSEYGINSLEDVDAMAPSLVDEDIMTEKKVEIIHDDYGF